MQDVFESLKDILKSYSSYLVVVRDSESEYCLDSEVRENGRPVFFGMAKVLKKKVSFHLMAVYYNPSLLETVSVDLRKRMQGKSCFNLKERDEALLVELKELTERCFRFYKDTGRI